VTAPCPTFEERARKNLAAIFAGLSSVGQVKVAERLGIVESTVSKMKGDELEKAAKVMAACGLKVVPEGYRCVDPRYMEAILTLAGKQLDSLRERPELVWEGDA
jgi:hypothetical protein